MEPKYRDHEVQFGRRTGRSVTAAEIAEFISIKVDELSLITSRVNPLLSPEAQDRAFGRKGEPGDVERIIHLARRIVSTYQDLLDWAAELRGTVVASEARELIDSVARMADRPISEIRAFVDAFVRETDALRARFAT